MSDANAVRAAHRPPGAAAPPPGRQAGFNFTALQRPTLFFPAGRGEPEAFATLADLAARVASLARPDARFLVTPATFTRAGYDTIRGVKIASIADDLAVWAFVQGRSCEDVRELLFEGQAAGRRA